MFRLRLDISYDGRGFAGWARQPGLRTVQGELERVLGYVCGMDLELTCAGRTDAGVHARGQVAHVDVPVSLEEIDLGRLNRALPDDVRVGRISLTDETFDARFSALWRRYTYRVTDNPVGPAPLERHMVLAWTRVLDVGRMNEAADALLGEHDFAPFCRQRDFATTVRELRELHWARRDDGVCVMSVRADAFCHSMVRSLVGVLLPVGDGRRP
ncbi:MAG: tRNA pseudouridine(38-40) synthase TruA, partial [bacterium]|nr:tRNA pseudouridine(38-40) synthase TruA [bacterium]